MIQIKIHTHESCKREADKQRRLLTRNMLPIDTYQISTTKWNPISENETQPFKLRMKFRNFKPFVVLDMIPNAKEHKNNFNLSLNPIVLTLVLCCEIGVWPQMFQHTAVR